MRREGASKEKAARIANSPTSSSRKGGKRGKYEEQSKSDVYEEAKKVGIKGRSSMSKDELIKALRDR
ncbi:hypothetical protein GCM10010094_34460 [Streptomyces flaveus]|uniref:Rho termination factor n=1 Tax=Streptomyces flaveus TaxID=66370 RepID=A0A917VFU9_9ACTN|nr:Rho termination factor [Streptomyces flaveus]GGK70534.1 hypothetical protein GCM10010094_34460 [Streptomyces flaveus]